MARVLMIDWDQKRLTAILTGAGKGNQFEVFSVPTEFVPNPAMSEELGVWLKEQMRSRQWQPAHMVALIGRDRLVARELRLPDVGPVEEPDLVRLQTVRELIDAPEDVVIDYHAWADDSDPGQRKVLALVLRKELLETYKSLAHAAGLRLTALLPRSAGLAALSDSKQGEAIVAVGHGWREIVLSRDGQAVLSRTLVGTGWAQEVRRVLASQGMTVPGANRVRLLGASTEDAVALAAVLDDPPVVEVLPSEDGTSVLDLPAGAAAALVGAARAQARKIRIQDFVSPKKPPPPSTTSTRRMALYGVGAASVLIMIIGLAWWQLSSRETEVASMRLYLEERKADNKRLAEDEKRLLALAAWETPAWLEELVDLACRISDTRKILITEVVASLVGTTSGSAVTSEFNSRMEIRGVFPEGTGDPNELDRIDAELRKTVPERHYLSRVKKAGNQFTLEVQVRTRSPASYTLIPPAAKPTKADKKSVTTENSLENGSTKDVKKEAKGIAQEPKDAPPAAREISP
jgi:hypothetical protein